MSDQDKRTTEFKFWSAMGAKLTGGMAGIGTKIALEGGFAGGAAVAGTVVAVVLAQTLERAGGEIIKRKLAPRQEVRVGRAITVAYLKLQEHQERGASLRDDDFFDEGPDERSAADEVTEAALQAAMNSAQERKVDFIGALLANVVVNRSIDRSTAHLLIEMAQSLSYRSFCLLKIIKDVDAFDFKSRPIEKNSEPSSDLEPLMIEVFELSRRGLIEMRIKADDQNNYLIGGPSSINPTKLRHTTAGRLLHDNMELVNLSEDDPVYVRTVDELYRVSQTGTRKGSTIIGGGEF